MSRIYFFWNEELIFRAFLSKNHVCARRVYDQWWGFHVVLTKVIWWFLINESKNHGKKRYFLRKKPGMLAKLWCGVCNMITILSMTNRTRSLIDLCAADCVVKWPLRTFSEILNTWEFRGQDWITQLSKVSPEL